MAMDPLAAPGTVLQPLKLPDTAKMVQAALKAKEDKKMDEDPSKKMFEKLMNEKDPQTKFDTEMTKAITPMYEKWQDSYYNEYSSLITSGEKSPSKWADFYLRAKRGLSEINMLANEANTQYDDYQKMQGMLSMEAFRTPGNWEIAQEYFDPKTNAPEKYNAWLAEKGMTDNEQGRILYRLENRTQFTPAEKPFDIPTYLAKNISKTVKSDGYGNFMYDPIKQAYITNSGDYITEDKVRYQLEQSYDWNPVLREAVSKNIAEVPLLAQQRAAGKTDREIFSESMDQLFTFKKGRQTGQVPSTGGGGGAIRSLDDILNDGIKTVAMRSEIRTNSGNSVISEVAVAQVLALELPTGMDKRPVKYDSGILYDMETGKLYNAMAQTKMRFEKAVKYFDPISKETLSGIQVSFTKGVDADGNQVDGTAIIPLNAPNLDKFFNEAKPRNIDPTVWKDSKKEYTRLLLEDVDVNTPNPSDYGQYNDFRTQTGATDLPQSIIDLFSTRKLRSSFPPPEPMPQEGTEPTPQTENSQPLPQGY